MEPDAQEDANQSFSGSTLGTTQPCPLAPSSSLPAGSKRPATSAAVPGRASVGENH